MELTAIPFNKYHWQGMDAKVAILVDCRQHLQAYRIGSGKSSSFPMWMQHMYIVFCQAVDLCRADLVITSDNIGWHPCIGQCSSTRARSAILQLGAGSGHPVTSCLAMAEQGTGTKANTCSDLPSLQERSDLTGRTRCLLEPRFFTCTQRLSVSRSHTRNQPQLVIDLKFSQILFRLHRRLL